MVKTLSPLQNVLLRLGAAMVLLGLVGRVLNAWAGLAVFAVGALLFAAMMVRQQYEGPSVALRRLRRQQLLGAACLVASAALMLCQELQVWMLRRNEWMVALAIGTVLLLYTAWRIPAEWQRAHRK